MQIVFIDEVGTENINVMLQAALNTNTVSLRRGATEYRVSDKVMRLKDNYNRDVFNGDIGIIKSVDLENKTLSVEFGCGQIEYDVLELDELTLSYAVTVHKSQGGEFPIVVMPFCMSHFIMLQRNLLYTGVTRAKRVLVIVGDKKAVGIAVRNNSAIKRNTMLAERLRQKNESELFIVDSLLS